MSALILTRRFFKVVNFFKTNISIKGLVVMTEQAVAGASSAAGAGGDSGRLQRSITWKVPSGLQQVYQHWYFFRLVVLPQR